MSNIAIVAIPNEDDYVWKLSSEKVPHLTLLFLGEADNVKNLDLIMQYVQHAAKTSLCRFELTVDHRGELGPESADVLFFDKQNRWSGYPEICNFRSYLLKDTNIKTAYDSTEQFPEWVPHLTMGFPATPAKEDKREFPGIRYVSFDKIAVWTGNYEGMEFPLDKQTWGDSLAYSGANDVVVNILKHHGVKGQKWGVRKTSDSPAPGLSNRQQQRIAKMDRRFANTVNSGFRNRQLKVHLIQSIAPVANSEIHKINAKPQYISEVRKGKKGKLNDPNDPLTKQYVKEVNRSTLKVLNNYLDGYSNASGTQKLRAEFKEGDFLNFKLNIVPADSVKHDDPLSLTGTYIRDESGQITGIKFSFDSITHAALLIDKVLAHHGVKGQKWGVRREKSSSVSVLDKRKKLKTSGGHGHPAHADAIKARTLGQKGKASGLKSLSDQELRDYANRLQLEQNVKRLNFNEMNVGKKFIASVLGKTGDQSSNQISKGAVRTGKRAITLALA